MTVSSSSPPPSLPSFDFPMSGLLLIGKSKDISTEYLFSCSLTIDRWHHSKPGSSPGFGLSYLRNFLRYCRLHEDHENTPLFPVSVGDMMLPSAFLQGLPSPSWIMPKLQHNNRASCEQPISLVISRGTKWCTENQWAQVTDSYQNCNEM